MHAGPEPTFVCLWIAPTLLSDILMTKDMAIVFAPTLFFFLLHYTLKHSKANSRYHILSKTAFIFNL